MIINEKLDKVTTDFSKLTEEQQDYVLGIMQALIFAKTQNQADETASWQNEDNEPLEK